MPPIDDEDRIDDEPEFDEDSGDGAESEGASGSDDGSHDDDEGEVSAEQPDASSADDDGAQEATGDEEEGQVKPRTRGENRWAALSRKNRELEERLRRAEAAEREAQNRQWQERQNYDAQQEREYLATLTDGEKAQYFYEKGQRELAQARTRDSIRMEAMADKIEFEAKASVNPLYAKHKDEVERMFQAQMTAGRPIKRELILDYVIGRRSREAAVKSTQKARTQGQRRIAAQRTRPVNAKGDTASTRGRTGSTYEERLKDVEI
jgi:hypothetical protein